MSHQKLVLTQSPILFYPKAPFSTETNYTFINLKHVEGITNIRDKMDCNEGKVTYTVRFSIRMGSGENHTLFLASVPAVLKQQAIDIMQSYRDAVVCAHLNKLTTLIGLTRAKFTVEKEVVA